MSENTTPPLQLPLSQRAIVQGPDGRPEIACGTPLPELLPGTVLVQTAAVALNPSDWKMGAKFPTPGAVIGMDFAGTVVAVHPDTRAHVQVGDRVCGVVHGSNPANPSNGAFAQYVRADPGLLLRIPPSLSLQQAATLGTGLVTACMALWEQDALALPENPDRPAETPTTVLVYGGSTASGTLAIQLLKLAGLDPIATCSPRNFKLVRAYGASAAFDYNRADVAEQIRKHTKGFLRHALDCITNPESVQCCYAAIGRTGGRYACLELCPEKLLTRRAIQAKFVFGLEATGDEVRLSGGYERPPDPEKHKNAVESFGTFQRLLDEGRLKTHPVQLLLGSWEDIPSGLQKLRVGSISGKKLVVLVH